MQEHHHSRVRHRLLISIILMTACIWLTLPGYGYANVSPAVKAKWGKMIEKYLRKSSQLKRVFLLIDIRHDPSDNDRMMYDWIVNNGYRPVIVATKLDKIKRSQISKQVKAVRTGLGLRRGRYSYSFFITD